MDAARFLLFGRRIAALLVDYGVVLAYMVGVALLAVGTGLTHEFGPDGLLNTGLRRHLAGFFVLTLPVALYFILFEASALRATPGKRLAGLTVTGRDGARLAPLRVCLRTAGKLLPWEISHAILWTIPGWPLAVEAFPPGAAVGFAFVWLLALAYLVAPVVDERGRTPYDRLAGAAVAPARSRVSRRHSPAPPRTARLRDAPRPFLESLARRPAR